MSNAPASAGFSADALSRLRALAEEAGPRVERIEIEERTVWVKRPGAPQGGPWHVVQRVLSRVAPHPMMRVTVDEGGPDSVGREARRIEAFADAGFLAPAVLVASPRALVLSDIGETVGRLQKRDGVAFRDVLPLIGETLGGAHAAGLVHGRPSRRDLTILGGRIGFLDFEEDPEAVMPRTVAQARDLWLLFIDLARAGLDEEALTAVFDAYRPFLSPERRQALAPVVRFAARASMVVAPLTSPFAGRDLKAPIAAARFLYRSL